MIVYDIPFSIKKISHLVLFYHKKNKLYQNTRVLNPTNDINVINNFFQYGKLQIIVENI